MSEFKEVWYVWDGVTKISNVTQLAYNINGEHELINNKKHSANLGDMDSDCNVVAYTKGEKRRRCVDCGGKGKWKENYWFTRECQTCNGTGWEYEK